MDFVLFYYVFIPFLSIVLAKAPKKSNVIAVFSEDDLAGKLPQPETVASEIPKHLILSKSKKLKVDANNPSKQETETRQNSEKVRIIESEDNAFMTAKKLKKSKFKSKTISGRIYDDESFDKKSKSVSVNDREEESGSDENIEPFIVAESTTISSHVVSNIIIPTASIVNLAETANATGENFLIAKIDATTRVDSDETITIPPQKIRQFTPKSRMNIKRASSSANRQAFDFEIILVMSFITLFIIYI